MKISETINRRFRFRSCNWQRRIRAGQADTPTFHVTKSDYMTIEQGGFQEQVHYEITSCAAQEVLNDCNNF